MGLWAWSQRPLRTQDGCEVSRVASSIPDNSSLPPFFLVIVARGLLILFFPKEQALDWGFFPLYFSVSSLIDCDFHFSSLLALRLLYSLFSFHKASVAALRLCSVGMSCASPSQPCVPQLLLGRFSIFTQTVLESLRLSLRPVEHLEMRL